MDDDAGPSRPPRITSVTGIAAFLAALAVLGGIPSYWNGAAALEAAQGVQAADAVPDLPWEILPPPVVAMVICCLGLSAFFSGSETAFFSIQRLRLRAMAEDGTMAGPRIAHMMENPGRLLTTILVGNMIVNVLIGVLLGTRVQELMSRVFDSALASYVSAVAIVTAILVIFGEILPKVFAVSTGEGFARVTVFPLVAADRLLGPVRGGLIQFTNFLFRIVHFHDLRAAPFITDEEFKSVLTHSEEQGVIEEEERQMIQGILEFRDVLVREIRTPRPDVVSLPEDATIRDAVETYREHEYSRMPVYRESLDTILGILVVKDVLPHYVKGELTRPVRELVRTAYFVPETMTVQQFVNDARRHRSHLAIVVDEYGGTEGIVTLEDALEEVVGEIMDEDEQITPPYESLGDGSYRVEGGCSLDDLTELLGVELEDEEHDTLAGFLMDQSDKVLEEGDSLDHANARFLVEEVEGKRVVSVRIEKLPEGQSQADGDSKS